MEQVTSQLAAAVPARRWRGIGLSGMIPTLVTVGRRGEPTGPAITWQDSRADARGDELREGCGADALYRLTGQWVDGRYLLPMYAGLAARRSRPGRRHGHDRVGQGLPVRLADRGAGHRSQHGHRVRLL